MAKSLVRPPVCADDRWYPARTAALRDEVSGYIERAPVLDLPGKVIGLVAPHAGYFFSGHVAGAAYRQVQGGDYDTVVVVGPDHRGITQGGLAYADFDVWRTPRERQQEDKRDKRLRSNAPVADGAQHKHFDGKQIPLQHHADQRAAEDQQRRPLPIFLVWDQAQY